MVLFEDLHARLIELARYKIHSGAISERGLARRCEISQPHLHNVLKNIRALSAGSADRLMQALGVTVLELLWRYPEEIEAEVRAIPVIRGRIGPGSDASLSAFGGYIPLPATLVSRLVMPVVARLSADMALPEPFAPNDMVLLDQNPAIREEPRGPRLLGSVGARRITGQTCESGRHQSVPCRQEYSAESTKVASNFSSWTNPWTKPRTKSGTKSSEYREGTDCVG